MNDAVTMALRDIPPELARVVVLTGDRKMPTIQEKSFNGSLTRCGRKRQIPLISILIVKQGLC